MNKKTLIKVLTILGFVYAFVVYLILPACCVYTVSDIITGAVKNRKAAEQMALEKAEKKFAAALSEFDGLFVTKYCQSHTGGYDFYFTYNGSPDSFFDSCVDFCEYAETNIFKHYSYGAAEDQRSRIFFTCGNRKLYFVYDKINSLFDTNVYMDDYSLPETFISQYRIKNVFVYDMYFTDEQREHLESIKNNYSYKIGIVHKEFPMTHNK